MSDPPDKSQPLVPPKVPQERPGPEDGRRHQNRLQRTENICAAGLTCFLAQGVDAVTIREIVLEAGIAKGSFYRYFHDKDSLVHTLFEPVANDVLDAMRTCRTAVEIATDESHLQIAYLTLATQLWTTFNQRRREIHLFLAERHGARTPARTPIVDLSDEVKREAIRMAEAAHRGGLLRALPPRLPAIVVVATVCELLWDHLQSGIPLDPMADGQALIDIVLHGVRADPRSAG